VSGCGTAPLPGLPGAVTICGVATPGQVAVLHSGATTVDISTGGLGGCPYAETATGNLATESLLWQLDGLGMRTAVDFAKLTETSAWLQRHLRD